jgi:hypothetical protein
MTAPYVVRTETGEYRYFTLPTEGTGPFGAGILLFLREGEYLDANLLADAVRLAIVGEPPGGTWYKTAYTRAIRTGPIDSAPRTGTLAVGNEVEVIEIQIVMNQEWGLVGRTRANGQTSIIQRGNWVKLLGMSKI